MWVRKDVPNARNITLYSHSHGLEQSQTSQFSESIELFSLELPRNSMSWYGPELLWNVKSITLRHSGEHYFSNSEYLAMHEHEHATPYRASVAVDLYYSVDLCG